MAEKLTSTPEHSTKALAEVPTQRPEAATYSAAERAEHVERAQALVAAESQHGEHAAGPPLPAVDDRPNFIDHAVKSLRLRQNLAQVQSRLRPHERTFSKVIHQPLVSKVSAVAGATVSRPSGMLGGGIVAFIGSLAYLYLARHIGFNYNYLLFLGLFIAGFILGVAGEYAIYYLRRLSLRR